MTAQFTRSIAIALALTLGVASASTAFAAARGGPGGPGAPGNNGSGGPSHSSNPIPPLADAVVTCNVDTRCPTVVPQKKPVAAHYNCDYIVLIDGVPHKDCRRN